MTSSISGKRIVLTGVSRGVGLASAKLLLESGASVLGLARDADRLERVASELQTKYGERFSPIALDLEATETPARLAAAVQEHFGGLDVLINNAGVMLSHDPEITAESDEVLRRSLDLNVLAPLRIARALIPALLRGAEPRIIHVSSGAGTVHGLSEPKIAAYRLSKWSLNGLTMLQAREYTGKIAVNALDPGWVKTDLGGPNAPGVPEESALAMLQMLELPFSKTGNFYKDGAEIPW